MTSAMFTEGLDPNALRWVREGPVTMSSGHQQRFNTINGLRDGGSGRGFVLPRPEKFRSGHLPSGSVPVSRTMLAEDDTVYGSDMDESSDTELEFYGDGRRYSIESFPQRDDDVRSQQRRGALSNRLGGNRYTMPKGMRRQWQYSSDSYSDFCPSKDSTNSWQKPPSARDTTTSRSRQQPQKQQQQRMCVNDSTEEGESDSGESMDFTSRFSRNNVRDVGVRVQRHRNIPVESYSSNVHFGSDVDTDAEKVVGSKTGRSNEGGVGIGAQPHQKMPVERYSSNVHIRSDLDTDIKKSNVGENLSNEKLQEHGIPSAPPFSPSGCEIKHDNNESGHGTFEIPCTTVLNDSKIKERSLHATTGNELRGQHVRSNSVGVEAETTSGSAPARVPTFHASCLGPWHSVIAYDACVRLCLHSWAKGCMEAPIFLENECALLRRSFGLQQTLLQSEEELLEKRSAGLTGEGAACKPKKTCGKIKVQVRKVRMNPDMPTSCSSFSSLRTSTMSVKSLRQQMSNLQSAVSAGWESLRNVRVSPHLPANASFSRHSLAYMHASTQYIKEVSGLLKMGVTTLRNKSSIETIQETYYCILKLKSSNEENGIRMQPGSGETHVFFPDNLSDVLIVEVYDSKGELFGRALAQVASIVEDTNEKLRWWLIYQEPEHELVGRVQLYLSYATSPDENNKCGTVAETVAYDLVLEVAMKVQYFQQRKLLLHGSWNWLLTEFATYYGVSDSYSRLRYLSYVMDVATPTADCLTLVHDLLVPVVMRSRGQGTLSHQENRILGEIEEQIEQILSLVFENYKSLDESLSSGLVEVFRPATGSPAPALLPAVKLYSLLHDILSPEAQLKLCSYFQAAAKKRSRRHLLETDEFIGSKYEGILLDVVSVATAYQKMKALCQNIRNEIYTDMEIHGSHVLPSFVDLPNIGASIYSAELCNRLRSFLVACPPPCPSPPVAELVIATADFQRDLASWNISPVKGGVDAKELFHLYIILWIQDKRLSLLESCKLDKVKWSGVRTVHSTTPFVDDMYDRLEDVLNEYEVIICRWPEYTVALENAVADIEKAVQETLDRQYADVLAPLKDSMNLKKFGLKYVQKLAKRSSMPTYTVPDELGVLLNTMKRLLDLLRPKIETRLKSWGSCIPDGGGNAPPGERLSEVTVLLRAKFRNYIQAVIEKLTDNTRGQNATKLKKILQDSRGTVMESDIRSRMQPLKDLLVKTINHLHSVFVANVFVAICRGFWDRMGQDVLNFLENRKENKSWYKASQVTVAVLDDTFASQMQQLLGNSLQEKDLEPPRSMLEVRSVLCKDISNLKDSNSYY